MMHSGFALRTEKNRTQLCLYANFGIGQYESVKQCRIDTLEIFISGPFVHNCLKWKDILSRKM